jgi:DMSO reductase anchor subunit
MELIGPHKQKVWGWPGVVNVVLGGMATGFYLLSSLLVVLDSGTSGIAPAVGFKLLAPVLTGLGFLSLMIEAGHPLRIRHLLRRLSRSWMSRETLAGITFMAAAALDWLFPHPALWALSTAAALGLMVSQGFIFYRVRTVVAWDTPLVPLLFLTSGFATGGGLMLLAALAGMTVGVGSFVIGLVCVVLNLAVWLCYLYGSRDVAFREATRALRHPASLIFIVGIGHLIPILLLSLAALDARTGAALWHVVVAALAGLAMVAGGASQKAGIVLKADYLRGIVLGRSEDNAQGAPPPCSLSSLAVHQEGRTG